MKLNVIRSVWVAGACSAFLLGGASHAWAVSSAEAEIAQQAKKQITGKVVDAAGEAVIGASVVVRGTSNGTITDIDGNFSLSVPVGKELQISYIGYITQYVKVPKNNKVSVVLEEDSKALDEVVVVAFGTQKKESMISSIETIKPAELKVPSSNLTTALAGRMSGVIAYQRSGEPGKDNADFFIRGVTTFGYKKDPLILIDGIETTTTELARLQPDDIAAFSILKDATATALYGARGANGIIMITTKKGTSGKARINFDAKWCVNSRAIKNFDVMSSPKNYIETAYQAIYNSQISQGLSPEAANIKANSILPTKASGGLGYNIYTTPAGELLIGSNGRLNPNATLGYSDGSYYYTPDNWADETFQNNLRQEYNINASGGNEKATYYLAFGYLDDQGVISGSGLTRYNGRFKGDYKLTQWLKVGANFSYINSQSRYPAEQDANATASSGNAFFVANNIAPVYPMYVRDTDKNIMLNNGRKVYDYGDGQSTKNSRSFMSIANPAGDLTYNKTEYLMDVINVNWFAEINPIKGLNVSARFGLNVDNTRYNDLGNAYMGQSASYGGTAYQAAMRTYGFDQQYVANYQFALKDVHHFDITAGYDGYTYEYTELYGNAQNLYNPESFYLSNAIDNFSAGGKKDTYSTKGFFGRVNYSYNDTYFGNISYRRDASSRFSPDNRWGNFWAASAAWMISREDFMLDIAWINMLKLKASFGQQGNDDILYPGVDLDKNYYPWMDQYKMTGANGIFADGTLSYKGNPDLTWETSTSYNIGVDFVLFDNTLNGTIEYFGRKSDDMLYNRPTAGSLGYTAIPMNVGSMTNSGVEIDLNYQILNNSTRIYEEGESMYRMYLVDYAGVDPETGEALYWAEDGDGNRIKTPNYTTAEGYKVATDDMMPTVYGGLGTTFEAYGFDASIQLSYLLGGKIYDSGYRRMMHGGSSSFAGQNWHKDIYNAWTPENTNTNIPRLNASDQYTNSTSTRWLTNSNYLSINNITVGYTLPKTLVQKIMLEKVRVYFTADNVGLISARKGLDPRQSYISATTALYTPIRTISGGISLTF